MLMINGKPHDTQPFADLRGANLTRAYLYGADFTGANLRGANLTGADFTWANLRGAILTEADFTEANLYRAILKEANLTWANLTRANFTRANLRGADFTRANLYGADFTEAILNRVDFARANLRGAIFTGANLREANLNPIKHDLWSILSHFPHEAEGVRAALREGRIEGRLYEGECACLIGTIANIRQCPYRSLPIETDNGRPAERWFFAITRGDTPETSPIAQLTDEWIEEWFDLPTTRLALARA